MHRLASRVLFGSFFVGSLLVATSAGANALDQLRTTDDIGINKVPHRGTSRILVIPMRVGTPFTAAELESIHNRYNPEGGPGTFRGFWQKMSHGAYDPVPFVATPVVYPECPIPSLGTACRINFDDFGSLIGGEVKQLLVEVFERVRDQDQVDLRQFDINAKDCPLDQECSDGFFDGVVLRTSMFSGIAFPLNALNNPITVGVVPRPWPPPAPPDGGTGDGGVADGGAVAPVDAGSPPDVDAGPPEPTLTCGIIALVPPDNHEYGHALGLIDQYAGPTMTGLMADNDLGLSAYSRLALGWGEATVVDGPGVWDLPPVEEGGTILKFPVNGSDEEYVLIENRGGPDHATWDDTWPGLYFYSVDEHELPTTPLGFFDALQGKLYFPNEHPPYLNVNMPLMCNLGSPAVAQACVMAQEGALRNVEHNNGFLGYHIALEEVASDGTIRLSVREGPRENSLPDGGTDPGPDAEPDPQPAVEPDPGPDADSGDCGCTGGGQASWPVLLLGAGLLVLPLRRRRRRA